MDYEKLLKNLKDRGFLPQLLKNGEEAKRAALEIIGKRSVGFGGSVSVRDIGLYEALKEQGNEVHWHWYAPKEDKIPVERAAQASEVFVTSSNAVMPDGRIVNIDGTGNRVAGLIFGPSTVIVIIGKNKIVDGGLDEAIARIKRDCCGENARRLGLKTPCAATNECHDCRTSARMCNVVAIHEYPTRVGNEFHVLLVDENLGL